MTPLEQIAKDVADTLDDWHGFSVREYDACHKLVLEALRRAVAEHKAPQPLTAKDFRHPTGFGT